MTITATSIDLSWSAPAGGGAVTAYTVLWRVTGSGAFTILADPVSGTSYTASGLVPTTSYDFAVFARNAAGPGGLSGIVTQATLGKVPYAPASFAAAAGTPACSAVGLSWAAPGTDSTHGPAASYTVSYRLNDTGAWTAAQSGITGTSASVTGLSHDALYGFKVDAVNSAGTNVSGATTTLTTAYAAPDVPAGLAAGTSTAITTSSLALSWLAPATDGTHDAAATYTLRYCVTSVGGSWTQITGISGTSQTVTGLASATEYDFQVCAVNPGGSGAFTATANGTTYTTSLTLNYPLPPQSYAPNFGPGVNVTATPTPATIREAFGASATSEPATGWIDPTNYAGSLWGGYPQEIATPGSSYLWIEAQDGGGSLIGLLVAGPYTVM